MYFSSGFHVICRYHQTKTNGEIVSNFIKFQKKFNVLIFSYFSNTIEFYKKPSITIGFTGTRLSQLYPKSFFQNNGLIMCLHGFLFFLCNRFLTLTRLLVAGRSPECSNCLLRFMEQ